MAALFEEYPSILHGNEKLDDLGLLDTQLGFIEGQGLIFLQPGYILHATFLSSKMNAIVKTSNL